MALAIALLSGGGWWVVRAPMVDKPQAKLPDVDLDLVTAHGEGEGGASGAMPAGLTMPAGASSAAIAAVSAASGASAASCGADDGPQYAEPEVRDGVMAMDMIRGASPRYMAAQARIDAALRASANPFDHAVADFLNVGDARTPSGRIDALVQQAVGTTDPRVYGLALRACLAAGTRSPWLKSSGVIPASCALLSARQWAALDPDNGVPWLTVLSQANAAKDASGQQEALGHLAAARRFDSRVQEIGAAVVTHLPDPAPMDDDALTLATMALGEIFVSSTTGSELAEVCRNRAGGDPARAAQCVAIGSTMYDHSDSMTTYQMGGVLVYLGGGDPSKRDAARAELRTLARRYGDQLPDEPCESVRFVMKRLVRAGQVGELAAFRELASAPAKR
jgi:hypothetical protein